MSRVERLVDLYMEDHSRPYRYEMIERFYVGALLYCVISEFDPYGNMDVTYTLTIDEYEKVNLLEK